MIYFTPETKIDQLKLQIIMQPEKLESTVSKDILILAGAALVLLIVFSFLALSEFLESLK
jgi:hypothetical protein